jgi:hypothetical protein
MLRWVDAGIRCTRDGLAQRIYDLIELSEMINLAASLGGG